MANTETLSRYPILFLGALSEIGTPLTKMLALAGYPVIAGTTSSEKLTATRRDIFFAGGVRLKGFVADLVDRDQVNTAYDSLHLEPGTPVHLFLWSVGAMSRKMRFAIGKEITSVYKNGKIIGEATQNIRAIVQAPGVLDDLMRVNEGMLHIVHLLRQGGHLTKDSIVSTLSSSGSDNYNPDKPDSYLGPWLYWPIAVAKTSLVMALRREAEEDGFRFLDYVAPPVEGTGIIDWYNKLIAKLKERHPDTAFNIPTITKADLVKTLLNQLVYGGNRAQIETVYISGLNEVSQTRPTEWDIIKYPF